MTNEEKPRFVAEKLGLDIIDPFWWCEKCQAEKSPFQVTYQETCTVCGFPVVWKETTPGKLLDACVEGFGHGKSHI